MRAFHFAVLAAGLLAAPLWAAPAASEAPPHPNAAAEPAQPEGRPGQRVSFVNMPLREALLHLFRSQPADCLVAVDVPDVPIRTHFSYANLDEAVDAVVKAGRASDAELKLSRDGGKYVLSNEHPFHPEDALASPAGPEQWAWVHASGAGEDALVDADLRNLPLREAIRSAFIGSGLQYTVDPNVPNVPVTLNLRDIHFPAMLRLVVRQAAVQIPGLEVAKQDQVYVVSIRPVSPPAAALPAQPGEAVGERKITLDIRDMPLRDVIALLFKGSGLQYAIDPNVPNVPITLNIRDISVPAALRLIIRQAAVQVPGLTVGKEGDIYLIRLRAFPAAYVTPASLTREEPTPDAFTDNSQSAPLRDAVEQPVQRRAPAVTEEIPPQEAPPDQQASDQDLTWEKIPIQFANASSLAVLFGGAVMPAPNGGPDAEGERTGLLLPDPARAEAGGVGGLVPPGITGMLGCPRDNSLMVRGTPDDIQALKNIIRLLDIPQRQFVVRLSTGGVTAEGRAGNNARLTLGDATHDRSFHFTALPRLNGDGTIDISVEGTLTLHGTPHPLATHVSLASGESVTLFTLGEGLGATRVWLRASTPPPPLNKGDDPS